MFQFPPLLVTLLFAQILLLAPARALEAVDGWMRALPPGQPTAAAYLTLRNPAAESVRVVSARADFARTLEIHESRQVDGMWRMRRLDGLEVPAGGSVSLEPGGAHLMIFGINQAIRPGDRLGVTLELESGETLPVTIAVESPGGGPHDKH